MDADSTQAARYTRGAIALHWIIAALILLNYAFVWAAEDAPKAEKAAIMARHMATGITILALSVARIVWRVTHPAPPYVESLRTWEAALARVTHSLFYFLIIAIPLTGWAMTSAFSGGMPLSWYGLFDIPGLPFAKDETTAGIFHEVHETLAAMTFFLLILHVAAALKHQFLDRNGTLGRMIPWLR